MLPIITITPNPCIDISTSVPKLVPEKKLYCTAIKKEPGGGGINVSRVIKRLGGNATAIYLAGGYTGEFFTSMLNDEKITSVIVKTENHTRENFIVKEESTNLQYRFGMPGPLVNDNEWKQCLSALLSITEVEYIVASGSLTKGMPVDFFAQIAMIAIEKKARLVLDTSGEALKAALEKNVFMIKPNLGELAFIAGVEKLTKETAISASRNIISKNNCEVVVVSMGAGGAMLITDSMVEHIIPPEVNIKSTVGAGDSMVAGITFSLSGNKTFKEALRFGVACGTATTMNEGTALCDSDDVEYLYNLLNKNT